MKRIACFIVLMVAWAVMARAEWPWLVDCHGEALRRVRMPIGGIGTGTISLSGRGSLVDWEIDNRPAKGKVPSSGMWAPHFAVRWKTASGQVDARLLEGPLMAEELEGESGCPVKNQGFPRFEKAIFRAAYPLAQITLSDSKVPLDVRLEAMNPLVPGDASASGIPAALFRWRITNVSAESVQVSVAATIVVPENKSGECGKELVLKVANDVGTLTEASDVREDGWNVSLNQYWRRFLSEGVVGNSSKNGSKRLPVLQKCVIVDLSVGESREIPFVIAWRSPERWAWPGRRASTNRSDIVGNFYAVEYKSAEMAAQRLLTDLPCLESNTVQFVKDVMSSSAPRVVKEAALSNVSTLRTETCFRTADGHFFAWEGCFDDRGSCHGSCTHVWGYEHALIDLWPELARDMVELYFGTIMNPRTGRIPVRVSLPLSCWEKYRGDNQQLAAADGQMQCIIKAFEYWKKCGGDVWVKRWYPFVRKALSFCWEHGGWDADRDGIMEGCQHNTMDVEYYGPNPQMEFLYLTALEAVAQMAEASGDGDFSEDCRNLVTKGKRWTESNLFNGSYYIQIVQPPKRFEDVLVGLRHESMGATDPTNPDYQLANGCLIDQLIGDYAARIVGLNPVADPVHARKALATILEKCRKDADDDSFNPMRGFAMKGEPSLRMAWYPEGRMPKSPFPYYTETMTGFEYVVATLQVLYGDHKGAEKTVWDIRSRYDGVKRNPFDEAECGHHYVRALTAWSVLKAWELSERKARRK